jgi:RND family efflux transporter MFP subunit
MNLENLPASPTTNGDKEPLSAPRLPSPSRLPRPQGKRRTLLTVGLLGLLVVGAAGVVLWWTGALFGKQPFNGPTFTARKELLKISIVARGSLESAKNGDIYCRVRSGTKGSTTATTIRWIIDAGTVVKGPEWKRDDQLGYGVAMVGMGVLPQGASPLVMAALIPYSKPKTEGEELMTLDSSGFQEQLKDKVKDVNSAYALKVSADQQFEIQKLDNESDIKLKVNALNLAEIDLKKYLEGDFEQAKKDVEGRIETARSDLEDWKDRAAWSSRMAKKGLMSKVQADADASRRDASQINMSKLMEEKRVLLDFTKPRTEQDLRAKLAEADLALRKAKLQAEAKLKQSEADKETKEFIYNQELSRKLEIEAEIDKCTVRSPQDGLVVYYVPEQVKGGGGAQQSIVAQGEPVREGQKMLQIPDLSRMLVNVRVPEALVSHLHSADAEDPSNWQAASIKVDAFPSRMLKGHVKFVDTVASIQDWFASDVKVYKTLVAIEDSMNGLKPGMSAEVTINAEESNTPVLVVPIQSVVGTISMGADREIFVVGPDRQPQKREVVVGMSNERLVEIKSGLKEGEQVVLNPQSLLKEDDERKPGKLRKSIKGGGEEWQGDGGAGKKGGAPKGMKKGPGGPPGGGFPGGGPGGPGGPNGGAPRGGPNAQKSTGAWLAPPTRPGRELPVPALHLGRREAAV